MAAIDTTKLTKIQKIAAFLIIVGEEAAAEVMKQFDNAQLEQISREMVAMPMIDHRAQGELLREFATVVSTGMNSVLGGVSYAQQALERARGEYTASTILDRVAPGDRTIEGGEEIRQMEGRQVLNLMKSEQPQTIAFILSFMDTSKAAELVKLLPPELREEVVERLGGMEATSRDTVSKVACNLNRHLDRKSLKQCVHRSGGVKSCADILNALDKDLRKTLLARVEERNPSLGAAIRKKVFSFDDLGRLSTADLQRVLRDVEMADLPLALKSAKPALIDAVLGAISKRAAEGVREELDMLGQQKMKDIQAAQDRVIQVVRRLEESEEITIDGGGDDNAFD